MRGKLSKARDKISGKVSETSENATSSATGCGKRVRTDGSIEDATEKKKICTIS